MTILSPNMQAFCEELAAKHGITLDRPNAHLRLSLPPSINLFLLVHNPEYVTVSISLGECDLISMHFDTSAVPWLLVNVTFPIGDHLMFVFPRPGNLEILDPDLQESAAKYTERLADELRAQG